MCYGALVTSLLAQLLSVLLYTEFAECVRALVASFCQFLARPTLSIEDIVGSDVSGKLKTAGLDVKSLSDCLKTASGLLDAPARKVIATRLLEKIQGLIEDVASESNCKQRRTRARRSRRKSAERARRLLGIKRTVLVCVASAVVLWNVGPQRDTAPTMCSDGFSSCDAAPCVPHDVAASSATTCGTRPRR